MLLTLVALFESHKSRNTWSALPALVKAITDLNGVVTEVATHLETTAAPSGATATKTALRAGLVQAALEVAAATHACAIDNDDGELAAQVDYSESALSTGREPDLVARCSKILALAAEHTEDLSEYGIPQAKLTALGKKITAFQSACPKPRQSVATRRAARQALPRLFRQARTIISRRIDKLMLQFKATEPEFYSEYLTVRRIVGQPGTLGGTTDEGAVQAAPTPVALPQAA